MKIIIIQSQTNSISSDSDDLELSGIFDVCVTNDERSSHPISVPQSRGFSMPLPDRHGLAIDAGFLLQTARAGVCLDPGWQ